MRLSLVHMGGFKSGNTKHFSQAFHASLIRIKFSNTAYGYHIQQYDEDAVIPRDAKENAMNRQHFRTITRTAFFGLFLLAPLLDIFRFDLTKGHFIIFGQNWIFGQNAFTGTPSEAALTIALNVFLPIIGFVIVAGVIIWQFGRLYCGWLCPHFSVVETIN